MTLAEKLAEKGRKEGERLGVARGREEGILRGRQEGESLGVARGREEGESLGILRDKQQVLIRQLTQKFGLSPAEESLILQEQDADRLDRALDAVIVARTKADVLSDLHGNIP